MIRQKQSAPTGTSIPVASNRIHLLIGRKSNDEPHYEQAFWLRLSVGPVFPGNNTQ